MDEQERAADEGEAVVREAERIVRAELQQVWRERPSVEYFHVAPDSPVARLARRLFGRERDDD